MVVGYYWHTLPHKSLVASIKTCLVAMFGYRNDVGLFEINLL